MTSLTELTAARPARRGRPDRYAAPARSASLVVVSVVFLIPIIWVFSTSLKRTGDILATPSTLFPHHPTTANYADALTGTGLGSYLVNSLIAAGGSTVIGLALAIPAAFGFAKFRYRFSGFLLACAVITRMFPPIALALPYFLEMRTLHLIDSRWGLLLAYIPVVLPLMLWILEGFFREFPRDVIEAARVDGLGVLSALVRVVVPISTPAIAVATLFGFLSAWNEFVIALTLTRTPAAATMPVGIAGYVTQFQTYWGQMTATASIYLLPVLVLTAFAQRGIVRGLAAGATKG